MNLVEKQTGILKMLAANDSPRGLTLQEICMLLKVPLEPSYSVAINHLTQSGKVEKRWQNDTRWPVSGRVATVVSAKPGQRGQRALFRATEAATGPEYDNTALPPVA